MILARVPTLCDFGPVVLTLTEPQFLCPRNGAGTRRPGLAFQACGR